MTDCIDLNRPDDWFDADVYGPDADDDRSSRRSREALKLDTICLSDFAELNLPPRKMILQPILPERGLGMLFAGRGIGKTHVALGIGYAVSSGGDFLRWQADAPRNVLYVDGEMPQEMLQDRLLKHMAAASKCPGTQRVSIALHGPAETRHDFEPVHDRSPEGDRSGAERNRVPHP